MEKSEDSYIVGYFPVFHRSYLDLIDKYPGHKIGVLDESVLSQYDYLRKDIRALEPGQAIKVIRGIGRSASLVGQDDIEDYFSRHPLVLPDDDITSHLLQKFPNPDAIIEPIFLRWDRKNVATNKEVNPSRQVTLGSNDEIVKLLAVAADKSANWWRGVGAALVADGNVQTQFYNNPMPTQYSSSIDGDPRIVSSKGVDIELSVDIHAEAALISEYARKGISTEGSSIFVTTFPCANCAKLIVRSGIKKCYYIEGYSSLDGQSVLESFNVEIIKVNVDFPTSTLARKKKYPS